MERRLAEVDPVESAPTSIPQRSSKGSGFRTKLVRRLWKIRSRIVASGEPLLGWKEIEREMAARRGEQAFSSHRSAV